MAASANGVLHESMVLPGLSGRRVRLVVLGRDDRGPTTFSAVHFHLLGDDSTSCRRGAGQRRLTRASLLAGTGARGQISWRSDWASPPEVALGSADLPHQDHQRPKPRCLNGVGYALSSSRGHSFALILSASCDAWLPLLERCSR